MSEQEVVDYIESLGEESPEALHFLLVSGLNELGQAVAEGRADAVLLQHLTNHLRIIQSRVSAQRGH